MVTRYLSLAPELCLAVANLVGFVALLVQGARAGRVAHRALAWGSAAALLAALATLIAGTDATWLMEAWRSDFRAQLFKAGILAGALVSVRVSRGGEDWRAERATGPVFRLACVTGLVAVAGAGDLLVLWLACDLATAALVLEIATAGRWSRREKLVRRMVAAWLPASLVMLFGFIMLSGIGGSTRLADLELVLPAYRAEPAVLAGLALAALSVLVRAVRLATLLGAVRRT